MLLVSVDLSFAEPIAQRGLVEKLKFMCKVVSYGSMYSNFTYTLETVLTRTRVAFQSKIVTTAVP